ncbi:MAG: DUF2384 domain-containing protein [Bacteroidetes bacterium]|nr:DUF2384 domain-containing protein [Bacteroidota bacterium]
MSVSKVSKVNEIMYQYGVSDLDKVALISRADEGLLSNSFFDLAEVSGIKREELAGFLNISLKTLLRYSKEKKRLNSINSEQILKIFSLYHKGEEVFGGIETFNKWLRKPAYGLGDRIPYELLTTISGIELIYNELAAIEYGDFS